MSEKVNLVPKLKGLQENLKACKGDNYYGPVLKADKEIGQKFQELEQVVERRLKEVSPEPKAVGNAVR